MEASVLTVEKRELVSNERLLKPSSRSIERVKSVEDMAWRNGP
jgi:hypothetical protein